MSGRNACVVTCRCVPERYPPVGLRGSTAVFCGTKSMPCCCWMATLAAATSARCSSANRAASAASARASSSVSL
eukprot:1192175-Prorocentrum_minimum.AAC.1